MKPRTLTLLALLAPGAVVAAGFQLQERSTRGLGRAFSGEAAIADDASVIASNPAAMMLLPEGSSVSAGLSAVLADVDVRGRYQPPGPVPPQPALGNDVSDDAYVPHFYLAHRLNDRLSLGFGSYTTFGLATNYPLAFSARGLADQSKLTTVNFNPALAFRLNDQWSLGAGFNALFADGTLTATLPNSLPTIDLAGDDWGYGFNLGVLYEPRPGTRFGLHYRSEVDLVLDGRIVSAAVPAFNGPGTVDLTLPDSLELSAYHELNPRWAIHADLVWTGWSDFDQLQPVVANSPVQPPATPENWDDAWRVSIGATWRPHDRLTLRTGIAYDQSPVDDAFRTLRIPDADRVWLSLGASFALNDCWSLDLAYTHLFIDSATIDETTAAGRFTGTVEGSANLVALGISGRF